MYGRDGLARLRVEDPKAAAAAVDALWALLARDEPRMFAALWRRANRGSAYVPPSVTVPRVEWIEEAPPVEVAAQRVAPSPARLPRVDLALPIMINPSPPLVPAELTATDTAAALDVAALDVAAVDVVQRGDLASL